MPPSASTISIRSDNFRDDVYEPKLFQGSGRLGRICFLLYMAVMTFAPALLVFLAILVGVALKNDEVALVLSFIAILAGMPCTVSMLIFCIRRLNDFNARGWWVLASFIPLVGVLVALALIFVPGTPGPNRYGVPPAPESSTVKILCALAFVSTFLVLIVGITIVDAGFHRYY